MRHSASAVVRALPWRERASLFARSFAVQGSWNYRTLIGAGLAFALLPTLRRIYGDDPERLRQAIARHSGLFNSHPYLASVAIGAVAALEAEGEEAAVVERFKSALRGSLGSMGDRLFWAGWRPVAALLALALVVAGTTWWVPVLSFLIGYNIVHVAVRMWGIRVGLAEGKRVAERLRRSRLEEADRWLEWVGPFLVGLLLPLVAAGDLIGVRPGALGLLLALGAGLAGAWLGRRIRRPVEFALGAFGLMALILGAA